MFIVFIGPPGAGKGTQCKRLTQFLDIPHLSTGEMLRRAKDLNSPVGLTAAAYMDQGRLVPDRLIVDIVAERLQSADCGHGCLFDGFPRTLDQAAALDVHLSTRGKAVAVALQLQVDEKELIRRMYERALQEKRVDDTPETIAERMRVFRFQTTPILDFYRQKKLLDVIDGMGAPDQVFDRIRAAVEKRRQHAS